MIVFREYESVILQETIGNHPEGTIAVIVDIGKNGSIMIETKCNDVIDVTSEMIERPDDSA